MKKRMAISGAASILTLSLVFAGCAHNPPPKGELAASKTAIEAALSAGGAEYAPVPLKTAQDKSSQAEKIVASGDNDKYPQAKQLAEQAAADAKVAQETAEAAKAKKALDDAQRDQNALRQEINRQN